MEPPFPLYSAMAVASHDNNDDEDKHKKSSSSSSSSSSPISSDIPPRNEPTLEEGWNSVVQLLRGRKRIAILTGAGISVSCGIPDFRTKGSGLYSTLDTAVRTYVAISFNLA
jgi:hypothetical protein